VFRPQHIFVKVQYLAKTYTPVRIIDVLVFK
jgi:hypothetical protein